jgi:hypothetical protein
VNLQEHLVNRKPAILKRWFNRILATYPADTSRFLQKEKDPFANPVGNTISDGISGLYEDLLSGPPSGEVAPFLDQIIRIRAIQDFSASEAVGFIFFLKQAIREELGREVAEESIGRELLNLESRIDELALLAFDIYMKCREKIYEIKSNEIRNRTIKLLERSTYVEGIPEDAGDSERDNDNGSTLGRGVNR